VERVKDSSIIGQIEQISVHYQANISNRFLRPLLLQLQIDKTTWDLIETLTERNEMYSYQGIHLDDLYRQILACARFVEAARRQVAPFIKTRLNSTPASGQEKILRDMAANNFSSNLRVFADSVHDLFASLVEHDKKSARNKVTVYDQMPELVNVGRMLVGG
jgi:hypothetical protein